MKAPFEFRSDVGYDVAGFGTNAVDYLIRVPQYPAFNSKMELLDFDMLPGGEIASTLVGLQRLGLTTAYAGSFGDDQAGKTCLDSLSSEGVDVSHARTVPGAKTQVGFIIVDEETGERTVLWKRDTALSFTASEAPLDLARSAKVLHMTPHDTSAAVAMAEAAREEGTIVSLDIDNIFDGYERLLELTDIMTASSDLLERVTGIHDKLSAMTEVQSRFGCRLVGVTLGDEGSHLLCDGVLIDTPAFNLPLGAVDTTGAGDAFRAGLLCGLLQGMDVEASAECANAVAALKCRAVGARQGLPNLAELQALLTRNN